MNQFFGKYRGKVIKNEDPLRLGRIQVRVPSVLGALNQNWAMPCVPYAGEKVGFYAIPPVGANVWVEFEAGNPNRPIWSGCFWGKGEVPAEPALPEVKVFRTEGITLTLDNRKKKGFSIEVSKPVLDQPLQLKMNNDTIELNHSDKRIVKMTVDMIELISDSVEVKLLSKDQKIELKNGSSTVTLSSDKIEIKQSSAEIKLSGSEIQITLNPAAIKLSTSGLELSASPAKLNVAAANIELSNQLGNIKVAPAGVNINNGALEVT